MTLEESIYRLLKDKFLKQTITGQVTAVDRDADSCTVDPFDEGPELFDVRLTSCIETKTSKILAYPKVGSTVMVGIIGSDKTDAFIVKYGEIDEVVINCDLITMNGGDNGGMVIIQALVNKINALEAKMNSHQHTYSGGITTPDLISNPVIVETTIADLEDTKVKH